MATRPHGFLAPLQINPAGYAGTGRGSAPYQGVKPAQPVTEPAPGGFVGGGGGAIPTGQTEQPGTPIRLVPPNNTAPVQPISVGLLGGPYHFLPLREIGVGITRIEQVGAYPAVRL